MPQLSTFECPACGASLEPEGDAPQIQCAYCGKVIVVPEELRQHPQAPMTPPSLAELIEARAHAAPPAPKPRANPIQTLLSVLAVVVVVGICVVLGALTDSDTQKSIAAFVAPSPTALPISRALSGTLPRQVRYAGLVFTIARAEISNRDAAATDPARQYRADRAYATLDLTVNNAETSKSVYLDSGVVRLRLADGKLYQPTSGWRSDYSPQASVQTKLVFVVPTAATWQGAQFLLSEPNKEPAMLPLDGVVPTTPYPITVKEPGQATVEQVVYKVTSVSLDLDWNGARADVGKRFLIFSLHFTNNSTYPGGVDILPNNFRLLVDGEPLAPRDAPIELLHATSSMDGQVAFGIPTNFGKLELQVGEVGHATARIPLALKPE